MEDTEDKEGRESEVPNVLDSKDTDPICENETHLKQVMTIYFHSNLQ